MKRAWTGRLIAVGVVIMGLLAACDESPKPMDEKTIKVLRKIFND